MIASDEPWVRQPVVGPGAWKRSASIRTQRCSISAEIGYSAWSMKLRCRFSAMIRCASGSIQVVTKVARLRCGSPSMREVLAHQPHRVDRAHPACGEVRGRRSLRSGTGCRRGSVVRLLTRLNASINRGVLLLTHRVLGRKSGLSKTWMTPPTANRAAPANVPQLTSPASMALSVAGRVNAASPARKNRIEPSWLTATTHQPISWRRTTT